MSIEIHEDTRTAYWVIVPCMEHGRASSIMAWVNENGVVHFRRGDDGRFPINGTTGSMEAPLRAFVLALRRILAGDHSRVRFSSGSFNRLTGSRILFVTNCGESRSFDANDLDALLTWASAPEPE